MAIKPLDAINIGLEIPLLSQQLSSTDPEVVQAAIESVRAFAQQKPLNVRTLTL